MMWKESYKLGDELIDAQHKALFDKTEALLSLLDGKDFSAKKQECITTILFLKDYAVKHFATEEEFQARRGYVDIEMHKLIHGDFINSVLAAEKELVNADFSLASIREFTGFLTAWLIYHVAGADQKIVQNKELSYNEMAILLSPEECFLKGIDEVFGTMLGSSGVAEVKEKTVSEPGEAIRIKLEGSYMWERDVTFTFSKDTALGLVNELTGLGLSEIDELARSALKQIAGLVNEKAVSLMFANKAGEAEQGEHVFTVNTKHGEIMALIGAC